MSETAFIVATSPQQLEELVQRLGQEKILAVDTESNSMHAYQERLCLVQFSTSDEDAIVDPLAVDLAPLAPLFADPGIEKIFHAAEYDLIVMYRYHGIAVNNIFDTMVAARVLGRPKVGLGNLLEDEFGIQLEKKYQRADWGKRPLLPEMLEYARLDTHYLVQLRDKLKAELQARDRWDLAQEDFARQPGLIPALAEPSEQSVWRIKGARDLKPQGAAILQELSNYREERAEKADLPLFKVIGDTTLTEIASARPHSAKDLEDIKGMSAGQIKRHARGLLAAVRRGEKAPPLKRPKRPPYDEAYVERLEALRNWRKLAAKEMEVESDVVLPRDLMYAAAKVFPATPAELEELLHEVPWRLAHYGDQIMDTLHPKQG